MLSFSGYYILVCEQVLEPGRVRTACGSSQGSQLLQTCLQRCCDGVAERDRVPPPAPKLDVILPSINVRISTP